MTIGVSVFLLAVGAVLAFAVQDSIDGVDLEVVGYILMAAGALGILISLLMQGTRRRGVVARDTVVERRVYDDPPV